MGAPVVTSATPVLCGHTGTATHVPGQLRATALGAPIAVASDQHLVAGCALAATPPAVPCVVLAWTVPALRVTAGGVPVLVQTSIPVATGPGIVLPGQARVLAT